MNGGAEENWPRVALEAFACGVPVVAENKWGWPEIIQHGITGFLANNTEEFSYFVASLAYDEVLRIRIAEAALAHLASIASPDKLTIQWKNCFSVL